MKVLICGAGHQGIAMAGHLALYGHKVYLWNRSEAHIKEIRENRTITVNGVVNGTATIEAASSDMAEVMCDFVMVTTPSSAHKDIAATIAPYVTKDTVIVLNPGRTFGAIEFASVLSEHGVRDLPHIAETQTIVYTCRKFADNGATIFALKNDVGIAALSKDDLSVVMERMPDCIVRHYITLSSVALTSLDNVGMILHCAPVLMNVGWIESPKVDFKYYYDGISESVAAFIEKMDAERLAVAKALGYEIESTADWMRRTYNVQGDTLYQCIRSNDSYKEIDAPPTISCRYTLEDIPNGLVPIEALGKELGVPTRNISTIIDLAESVLNREFRKTGRVYGVDYLKKFI